MIAAEVSSCGSFTHAPMALGTVQEAFTSAPPPVCGTVTGTPEHSRSIEDVPHSSGSTRFP